MVDIVIQIRHALGLFSDGSESGQVTGLVSTFTAGTFIDLSWDTEANAVFYNVYANGIRIGNTSATTFRVTGLTPETLYQFQIAGTDAEFLLEGPRSAILSITTPALPEWTGVPFPLFDLAEGATFDLKAFIRPAPTAGYTFTSIGTALPTGVILNGATGVLTYNGVAGVTNVATYAFRYSDNLNPVAEVTNVRIQIKDDTVPTVPTNLQSASITPATFTLSWDASTDPGTNLDGYKVWRNGVLFATLGVVTSYAVTGQAEGSTNLWRVSAFDDAGNESPLSAGLSVAQTTSALTFSVNSPPFLCVIPGGAGFGTSTAGGSGRDAISGGLGAATTIWFITNLNLSGAGSWKAFMQGIGRRIGVVCVSGLIDYSGQSETTAAGNGRNINIVDGNMTYWGQCAPAPGLHVRGAHVTVNTNAARDCVFWHMTLLQDLYASSDAAENNGDCFGVAGSSTGITNADIVCAYSAFMHSTDEVVGVFYGANNITFYKCIFAEPFHSASHPKGPHGYGPLFTNERHDCRAAILNCLFAHCWARNPATAAHQLTYAGNVVYNPGDKAMQLEGRAGQDDPVNNIEGNVFIKGPNTTATHPVNRATATAPLYPTGATHWLSGNRVIGSGWDDSSQADLLSSGNGTFVGARIDAAYPAGYNVTPTTNVEEYVRLLLRAVGPRAASKLPHIQRVINHVEARLTGVGSQGAIISSPSDFGGWGSVSVAQNFVNHTQGGDPIPGITTQSSSPTALGTAGRIIAASGYTVLEEWAHRRHNEVA